MFAPRVVTLSFAKSVFCRTNKSAPPPEESVQSSMHYYCQTSQNMIYLLGLDILARPAGVLHLYT